MQVQPLGSSNQNMHLQPQQLQPPQQPLQVIATPPSEDGWSNCWGCCSIPSNSYGVSDFEFINNQLQHGLGAGGLYRPPPPRSQPSLLSSTVTSVPHKREFDLPGAVPTNRIATAVATVLPAGTKVALATAPLSPTATTGILTGLSTPNTGAASSSN